MTVKVMVVVKWDDRMHLTSNELDGNDDERPTCEGSEEATSIQWQHIKLMEGGMLVTSSRAWDTQFCSALPRAAMVCNSRVKKRPQMATHGVKRVSVTAAWSQA